MKSTMANKLKMLYLYDIFLQKTDENHLITMSEILSQLEMCGIQAERKAIYNDIEALRAYGVDIISVKGNKFGYYVANREFELPELKLLADADALESLAGIGSHAAQSCKADAYDRLFLPQIIHLCPLFF